MTGVGYEIDEMDIELQNCEQTFSRGTASHSFPLQVITKYQIQLPVCVSSVTQLHSTLYDPMTPLSTEFSMQESQSRLPFTPPGEPMSPALAGRFFTTVPAGKPLKVPVLYSKSYCLFSEQWCVSVNTILLIYSSPSPFPLVTVSFPN